MYFLFLMVFLITICINWPFTLFARLPANSRLLVDILGESKLKYGFLTAGEVSVPSDCIIQGPTVDV